MSTWKVSISVMNLEPI